jgi:hypothetical protein
VCERYIKKQVKQVTYAYLSNLKTFLSSHRVNYFSLRDVSFFRTYSLPSSESLWKRCFVYPRLLPQLPNDILIVQKHLHAQVYRSFYSNRIISLKLQDSDGGSSSTRLNCIPTAVSETDDNNVISEVAALIDVNADADNEDGEGDVEGELPVGENARKRMGRRLRRKSGSGRKGLNSAEFNRAVRIQDFDTAIRLFDEICQKYPKNERNLNLYMSAISVCYRSEHLERAQQLLGEMSSLFPASNLPCLESVKLPIIRCLCDKGDTGMKIV